MKWLLVLVGLLLCTGAEAANRFAVCTVTCTWDASSTAMWSTSTGGATGASVPGTSDAVILDAATCVGGVTCTVTINTTITVQSITAGACTASTTGCIIDFSVNNNNVTVTAAVGINFSGTGTRDIRLGNGTWNITGSGAGSTWGMGTVTNLTFNANSSTINFTPASGSGDQILNFGNKTTNTVTLGPRAGTQLISISSNASTITTLNITAPNQVSMDQNTTITVTNAMVWTGTRTQPIFLSNSSFTSAAVVSTFSSTATNTCSWCVIMGMTFIGGGTFTANNSFNGLNNSGITFNGPSAFGSGGGCILGGWLLWRDFDIEHINDNFPAWLEKAA